MTELERARGRIAELERKLSFAEEKLSFAMDQLAVLQRHVFGRKSERTPPPAVPGQLELEIELSEEDEESGRAPEDVAAAGKKKGGSRKGRQTRAALFPESLPVVVRELVPLEVQAAPERWRRIGEEVSEKLERDPARVYRHRLVRPTYVKVDAPHEAPVTAALPPQVIEGSLFGTELLIDLAVSKFVHHQPLYRQAKALEWESGVRLSRATLCQSVTRLAEAVEPVVRQMAREFWAGGVVQLDLTPVRCLSGEREGGSFLGQMWVCAAPGGDVLWHWSETKEAKVARDVIPEGWQGVLQVDGGSEVACHLRGGKDRAHPPPQGIVRAACWAHVRRKFFEGAQTGCSQCARLLKIINVLYRIEREIAHLEPQERARVRQKRSARVIRGLRRRMDAVLARERPKSAVGKAILYARGQWDGLLTYLNRGEVPIDNNGVENAIRPCALGKKNYLFIGAVHAGQRAAHFYTLLGSCLRRGLNPRAYLQWLFARLPTATNHTVASLTPAAYAAGLIADQCQKVA